MSEDVRRQIAEALREYAIVNSGNWRTYADALLPVVDRIARQRAAKVLRAAAQEQRNEADQVPWDDEGTHADGHRCAATFLDRRATFLDRHADALTAEPQP